MKKLFLILFLLLIMTTIAYSQFFNSGSGAGAGGGDVTSTSTTQTWGAGTTLVWTFSVTGTDPTFTASAGALAVGGKLSATTYGSDGTITDAELLYLGDVTSAIQAQLDARCLETTFGTSIGGGLILDGTTLKTSTNLQLYSAITPSANMQSWLASGSYALMRTSMGLAIGTNVQGYDADLTTYAGITPSANAQTLLAETFAQMQGSLSVDDLITLSGMAEGSVNLSTFTGTTIADNVTIKAALQALETGLELKQASDSDLTYLAGFTPSDNVKSIWNAADFATIRTSMGLVIGTNVQAYDADLTSWAGITAPTIAAAGDVVVGSGANALTKITKGANNTIFGVNSSGTLGFNTNLSLDDSAPQFYNVAAPTKLLGIDPSGMTAGYSGWIKLVATSNSTGSTPSQVGNFTFATLTATPTSNQLTKFSGTAGKLTNSTITEDGTDVNIGALNLLGTGIIDGKAPITIVTTSAGYTIGSTYKSGYLITNPTSASATFIFTLPTAVAGLQYMPFNGAAKTGILRVYTALAPTGTQYIDLDGVLTANTGGIEMSAVAGNCMAFVGIDSTNWKCIPTKGTATKITR